MKGQVIVLDQPKDRRGTAALIVDGRLEDLLLAPKNARPMAGDICVVRVTRKLPNSAAFCETQHGEGYLRDAQGAHQRDVILAQVQSLPEPGKAVTLTRRILFKGPRVILTPHAPGVNVSKKIGNAAERQRLQAAVEHALTVHGLPMKLKGKADGIGAIVRTAARSSDEAALAREIDCLLGSFSNATALLDQPQKLLTLPTGNPQDVALRDWLIPLPDAIVVAPDQAQSLTKQDDREGWGPSAFFGDPDLASLLTPDPEPFESFGLWDDIGRLRSPDVPLGEGSMGIEVTRALVAVDVNTGGDFSQAAGLKANLAAANELPRQLRLRGLGGQIVVDFAPMPKQHRKRIDEALASAFRKDPVDTNLIGWTRLGLFEIQRKRDRYPLSEVL